MKVVPFLSRQQIRKCAFAVAVLERAARSTNRLVDSRDLLRTAELIRMLAHLERQPLPPTTRTYLLPH
jgi:hypothetical protein